VQDIMAALLKTPPPPAGDKSLRRQRPKRRQAKSNLDCVWVGLMISHADELVIAVDGWAGSEGLSGYFGYLGPELETKPLQQDAGNGHSPGDSGRSDSRRVIGVARAVPLRSRRPDRHSSDGPFRPDLLVARSLRSFA
jgi:hypothetical protein